jgi:hypothetical protein
VVSILAFLAIGSGPVAAAPPPHHGPPAHAKLTGLEEVPSILSSAHGDFEARVTDDGAGVEYKLKYSGFDSDVAMAHIHIGQPGVNGGIAVFLCGGGSAPACPTRSGEVTDTFVAADVLAIGAQDLAAGDLEALLRAIRDGVAYVNVHSADHPGGEIRGQLKKGGPPKKDD